MSNNFVCYDERFLFDSLAKSFQRKLQKLGVKTKIEKHYGSSPHSLVYYSLPEPIEDIYRNDPIKACKIALLLADYLPEKERLEKVNELIKGYGTEAIRGTWENGYWCDIVACYVNLGDTYATTVMHVRTGKFIVCSWGDWIERNQKKYGIY